MLAEVVNDVRAGHLGCTLPAFHPARVMHGEDSWLRFVATAHQRVTKLRSSMPIPIMYVACSSFEGSPHHVPSTGPRWRRLTVSATQGRSE